MIRFAKEAEVMAKGAEHAKTAHKMTAIPPEMAANVKAAIKEKKYLRRS